jgi:hypothetical protein
MKAITLSPTASLKVVVSFILTFICLLPQLSLAAEGFQEGKKLYVAPTTGINLRAMPTQQAPVLAKLRYNTLVTVVADTVPAEPLQVKVSNFNNGLLSLQGHWVKVRVGKTTGYVFDGMLSQFKGLELGILQEEPYYAATFGKPVKTVIPKSEVIQGHKVDYETVITTYPKGLKEEHTLFDGCHNLTYTYKMSFNEAYWLIQRMLIDGDAVQDVKISQEGDNTILTWYSCT